MRIFVRILTVCALWYGIVLTIDYRSYVKEQPLMVSAHFTVFELLCPIVPPGKLLMAVNFSGTKEYELKLQGLRTGRYKLSVSFPKPDAKNGIPCFLDGKVMMMIIQHDHVCCRKFGRLESMFCKDGMFVMDSITVDVPEDVAKGVACDIRIVFDEHAMHELSKYSDVVISMRKGSTE